MINPINSTTATPATQGTSSAASAAGTAALANQNVFLQLLVAQLKYQDPDNPADGTQFVTQLAQFADLSNTTDMASDLDAIKAQLAAAGSTPSSTTPSSTTPSSTTPSTAGTTPATNS